MYVYNQRGTDLVYWKVVTEWNESLENSLLLNWQFSSKLTLSVQTLTKSQMALLGTGCQADPEICV